MKKKPTFRKIPSLDTTMKLMENMLTDTPKVATCHVEPDGVLVRWGQDSFILEMKEVSELLDRLEVANGIEEFTDDFTDDLWATKTTIRYGGKRFPIDIETFYHDLQSSMDRLERLKRAERERMTAKAQSEALQDELVRELGLGTEDEIKHSKRVRLSGMSSHEIHDEIVRDLDL